MCEVCGECGGCLGCFEHDNPRLISLYTPPGWDLYCPACRLYAPTYMSSPHIPLETSIESLKGTLLSETFLDWEPFEDVKHNSSHSIYV